MMSVTWRQAQQQTIAKWLGIRESLETADSIDLITRLNEACPLCEKANEKAVEPGQRCDNCMVFTGVGSCQDVDFELTESVLNEDWETARAKTDEVIELIRRAELPDGELAPAGTVADPVESP